MQNNLHMTSRGERDASAFWAGSFLRSLLDSWREASGTDNGIFHPNLDRHWQKTEGALPTLVSQSRLIYNFSRGYQAFHDPCDAAAARRGLEALAQFFHQGEGGYCWAVAPDGAPVDKTPNSYGHAFCILALSAAAEAFHDAALAAQAQATWHYTARTFLDARGGLVWQVDRGGGQSIQRSQNPIMHMFEALMALHSVNPIGQALQAARHLLTFAENLEGFKQGRLIENYAADWTPLPPEQGGVVNIGHQFEWAFLLSEWHRHTEDANALMAGRIFLETGLAWGMDTDGGVREACTPEGRLMAAQQNLWPQCEAVRALCRYVRRHGETRLARLQQRALRFYQEHFVDNEHGGVFAAFAQDGTPRQTHKGDIWKLDYHSLGMFLELMGVEDGCS